jgi:geranylgeranyl reductase family protein
MPGATLSADVLVVGAGPAGAAAAYHLARHGVDVLVVDKAAFPREKVCGDGLTPRGVAAIERMGVEWQDSPSFARADGLRTYGTEGVILDLAWPTLRSWPDVGLVCRRFDLDDLLVRRATAAGARLMEGTEVLRPVTDGLWVTGAVLNGSGPPREVRTRHVVAADGHASRFGQAAGVRRDPTRAIGIAARRYYRSPRPFEPILESFLNLRGGGGVIGGYGWIFFLPDGVVNVGAGLLSTFKGFKDVSAQSIFDAFVRGLPPEWGVVEANALGPVRSGPLPTAMNRSPLAVPGLLLTGDAAGMVNPFNGEGISCAIESAEIAAELIVDALARDRPAVTQLYPSVLRERYGRYYAIGNKWARLIGDPRFMRLAVRYGIPRRRLMTFAMRVLANLTDGRDGDVHDRLMHLLVSLAPERPLAA